MRKKKRITISQPYKNYPLQPYKNYPLQQLQKPTDIICRVVLTVQVQCSMSLFDRDFNILTLHCRAQNWTWIFRFGPTTWTTSTGSTQVNCFIWVELNWSNYNSSNHHGDAMADFAGVIFEPVSVRSPCITWSMHWSDPLHRAESLAWNRVTAKFCSQYLQYLQRYPMMILKFSSVTQLLQCPRWKPTIYH